MRNLLTALARAVFGLTTPRAAAVSPVEHPRSWGPFVPLTNATHRDLGCGTRFALNVAGESYRQPALHALDAGRLQRGEAVMFTADLIPEPDSPYDPNAIRVNIQGGAHVGYLSRDDAIDYRPVFDALTAQHLIGVLPDKPSIGVLLDVKAPGTLLRALAPKGPRLRRSVGVRRQPR